MVAGCHSGHHEALARLRPELCGQEPDRMMLSGVSELSMFAIRTCKASVDAMPSWSTAAAACLGSEVRGGAGTTQPPATREPVLCGSWEVEPLVGFVHSLLLICLLLLFVLLLPVVGMGRLRGLLWMGPIRTTL